MNERNKVENISVLESKTLVNWALYESLGKETSIKGNLIDKIVADEKESANRVLNCKLSLKEATKLLATLKHRFERTKKHYKNPEEIKWKDVQTALENSPEKLWSLSEMERTGGEPDVMDFDEEASEYIFYDCSAESPKGRIGCVYDIEAEAHLHKYYPSEPCNSSAERMADSMGMEILDGEKYRKLQCMGEFDEKSLNWLKSPVNEKIFHGGVVVHYARFSGRRDSEVYVLTDCTHNTDTDHPSWGALGGNGVGNPRERGFRGLLKVPVVS